MVCKKLEEEQWKAATRHTHTSIDDDYEERAENITMNHPHSSCYDGLMKQSKLLGRARKLFLVFRNGFICLSSF